MTDLEIEYRNLVMGDEFQEELLIKVGMKPDIKEQDKEEDDERGNNLENGDGGNETVRSGAKLSNTAHADGFRNSEDNTLGEANEASAWGETSTVNGGNMGQPKKIAAHVKTASIKMKRDSMRAMDKALAGDDTQQLADLEQKKGAVELLGRQLIAARKVADDTPEPLPSWKIRLYGVLRRFVGVFLPFRERNMRAGGHVYYNEVIMATAKDNGSRRGARRVAQVSGGLSDDSSRLSRGYSAEKNKLFRAGAKGKYLRAQQQVLKGVSVAQIYSQDAMRALRRAKQQLLQDENTRENLWQIVDDPRTGTLKKICVEFVSLGLAVGYELANICEDLRVAVGPFSINELDEETLESLFDKSQRLRDLCAHVEAIQQVTSEISQIDMGWLRLAGSIKLKVSFAKEPYKRDAILKMRPIV